MKTIKDAAIEAAKEFLKTRESGDDVFEKLFNAGMLVLPQNSSDTKD